jgi:hypothetical protein
MADNEIPVVPAVPLPPVTPGNQTSEYKIAKTAGLINLLGLFIGAILSIGTPLVQGANPNSKYAIIGGCILGLAAVVNKTLLALGYSKGRSDIKVEQLRAAAIQGLPPQN